MRLTKVAELLAGQGLHFDDFRPLVSQHHGGHRSGDHAGEVDNFDSIERAHSNSVCLLLPRLVGFSRTQVGRSQNDSVAIGLQRTCQWQLVVQNPVQAGG